MFFNLKRKIKDESGQVMVIMAIVFVAVCGFGAIAVDYGSVAVEKSHLQNAIDAAALAAAQDLPDVDKATASANKYIALNGYSASNIHITFSDSDYIINIDGSETVSYTLGNVLGIKDTTVSAHSSAKKERIGGAFNYTLFSGSPSTTLSMTGSGLYIGGSAHSNYNLSMTGAGQTITGAAEAVSKVSITGSGNSVGGVCQGATVTITGGNNTVGSKVVSAAPLLDMPDFSEAIKNQAEACGQLYMGNITYNGTGVNVDTPIYVDGNVTVVGSNFFGKGCILATGNITFTGSSLINAPDDAVCFYSKNGNISITGSNAVIKGILYAPNGTIAITGSGVTVNGRIIGNKLTLTGSGYKVIGGENDFNCLPASSVKLVE